MTTIADTKDDTKQEAATSQSPLSTTADVESTPTNSETESADVDELAQAVGQIHVSEVDVDESKSTTKDELDEEMPEALRKVASWIMDGTVKNILVLTGAGVRYVHYVASQNCTR